MHYTDNRMTFSEIGSAQECNSLILFFQAFAVSNKNRANTPGP
jgi:hypothetical protein